MGDKFWQKNLPIAGPKQFINKLALSQGVVLLPPQPDLSLFLSGSHM